LAWRTFLHNEIAGIWAADLLVVQTLTFKTLYVLFFIEHARRHLVHFNVTEHPTVAWVWQRLLNATPSGKQPRYLIHDRDGVYGADFDARVGRLGIRGIHPVLILVQLVQEGHPEGGHRRGPTGCWLKLIIWQLHGGPFCHKAVDLQNYFLLNYTLRANSGSQTANP
jgi:hypothetical protein